MIGWIKIHRSLLTWEWFRNSETLHVFLYLLLKANREPGKWMGVEIKRGQVITGRKVIAENTGISERSVRTSLNRLKSTNELTIKTTNKFSIITISNYDKYQSLIIESDQQNDQQIDQQTTNKRPANDHKQELKNNKNLINNVVEFLNQETGKNFKPSTKSTEKVIHARIKEGYTLEEFKKVISLKKSEWLNTEMEQYLRPETLFGNKFEAYLNAKPINGFTKRKNKDLTNVSELH